MYQAEYSKQTEIEKLLPQQWMDAQTLSLGLKLLLLYRGGLTGQQGRRLQQSVFSHLRMSHELPEKDPSAPLDEVEKEYLQRLEEFPPIVLKTLIEFDEDLLGETWLRHKKYWEMAYHATQGANEHSPIVGARLLANRIVDGNLMPSQLAFIAKSELCPDWECSEELYSALGSLADKLRNKRLTIIARLEALAEFRRTTQPKRWAMVENVILQQIFSWPLLVLHYNNLELGFSLPVAIGLSLSGGSDDENEPFLSRGVINAKEWENPLRTALRAATDIWKEKHLAWDKDFRKAAHHASPSIDLRIAEAILQPFLGWGCKNIDLTGRSAEAYLALALLAQIIDPAALENTCATGKIGRSHTDREGGGDHAVEEPEYLDKKFLYAKDTLLFDTFLVPKPATGVETKDHLKVRKGQMLSDFAKHVFRQKWRKNRFVRCPDLALSYRHPHPKIRNAAKEAIKNDSEVGEIISKLHANQSGICYLDHVKASSVAKALYHINSMAVSYAEVERKNPKEHVASFAFIRAVPDETNDRFWQVVWELLSGETDTFFDFQFMPSLQAAGDKLIEEMNKFKPTAEDPRRSPDVLVIVDPGHQFSSSPSVIANGPFNRLRLNSLLERLEGNLQSSPLPFISRSLGKTRIIIVSTVEEAQAIIVDEDSGRQVLDEKLLNVAKTLSIFRYGFTHEMAQRLLNIPEAECEQVLKELTSPRVQHKQQPWLIFASSAEEYFLQVRMSFLETNEKMADRHLYAAMAISGLVAPTVSVIQQNFREGLTPHWLHEAQWHMEQAKQLGGPNHPAHSAHHRLSRVGELFGWTRIRWAAGKSGARNDGEELLEALKQHINRIQALSRGDTRYYLHPVEWILAARFANRLAQKVDACGETKAHMIETRNHFLTMAFNRANNLSGREGKACLFLSAMSKACMILSDSPNSNGLRDAKKEIDIANHLKEFEEEAIDLSWFEFMGDRGKSSFLAAREYKKGINNSINSGLNLSNSLVIKYIGVAVELQWIPSPRILSKIKSLRNANPHIPLMPTGGLFELPWIKKRWDTGRDIFLKSRFHEWENNKPITGLLKQGSHLSPNKPHSDSRRSKHAIVATAPVGAPNASRRS